MFLSIRMLFCLEKHMSYRVASSTLHCRKVYLGRSQGLAYTVHGRKVYLTRSQGLAYRVARSRIAR